VIGMQWPILELATKPILAGFYSKFAETHQVDYALSMVRKLIVDKVGEERRDWAAPVLVVQAEDTDLLK
jgi:hypothetical protein